VLACPPSECGPLLQGGVHRFITMYDRTHTSRQAIGWLLAAPWRFIWRALRQAVRAVRRLQFAECGCDVQFDPFGSYTPMQAMHFGSHVYIGPGARITAHEGFYLGNHSFVGPGLLVIGGDHNVLTIGRRMLEVKTGGANREVRVEHDVYLGARVTLLKGVVVREGSVVGACSVVTKSVPPYTIAAGSPCRPLRPRFSHDELRTHLAALESRYSYEDIVDQWRAAGLPIEMIDKV